MLIASIVIAWVTFAVGLGVWAVRSAGDPPLAECFDCNRTSCEGCPYIEKSAQTQEAESAGEQETRLAA